eukprot:SAG31_NODE_2844_length_5009_cov_2.067006_9_plen_157_part_00
MLALSAARSTSVNAAVPGRAARSGSATSTLPGASPVFSERFLRRDSNADLPPAVQMSRRRRLLGTTFLFYYLILFSYIIILFYILSRSRRAGGAVDWALEDPARLERPRCRAGWQDLRRSAPAATDGRSVPHHCESVHVENFRWWDRDSNSNAHQN